MHRLSIRQDCLREGRLWLCEPLLSWGASLLLSGDRDLAPAGGFFADAGLYPFRVSRSTQFFVKSPVRRFGTRLPQKTVGRSGTLPHPFCLVCDLALDVAGSA